MFLSNFGETTLACVDRWRTIVVVSTLALALNVALNLLFIPRYGYVAAAWVTLITEGAYFVMTAAALRAFGHRAEWARLVLRPALSTIVFAATLWATRGLPLLVGSVLASAGFVAGTFAFGVWDPQERALALSFLGAPPSSQQPDDDAKP
jgi:O-antigen/teichoic acid export membrane protein